MVFRIVIITVSLTIICLSVARLKADVDMKTSRVWFASRNIERALHYNKSAIKWNPTEMKYYRNLFELEGKFKKLLLDPNIRKVIIRRS